MPSARIKLKFLPYSFMCAGACLKNHFRHLNSPIHVIFTPDSGYTARYPREGTMHRALPGMRPSSGANLPCHALQGISCPLGTSARKHFSNTLQAPTVYNYPEPVPDIPACTVILSAGISAGKTGKINGYCRKQPGKGVLPLPV